MKYSDLERTFRDNEMETRWVQIWDKVGNKYEGFLGSYTETGLSLSEHHDLTRCRRITLINIKDILSIQLTDDAIEVS
jgi:hypothetical protein